MPIKYMNQRNLTDKMELIKVSSRGQIVIPEEVRKKHNIRQGDKLVLIERNGVLLLKKATDAEHILQQEWARVSEQAFARVWDNETDDETWNNA